MSERTPRGFRIYKEFRDDYGGRVRVQESSNALAPRVWVFIDSNEGRKSAGAHLDEAQARALIDGLADFLEHRCPYVEPPKPEPCEAPRMLGTIMLHRCQKPKGHNGPHEWSEFSGGVHAWSQWEDEAPRSPSEQQTVAPSATLEGDRE